MNIAPGLTGLPRRRSPRAELPPHDERSTAPLLTPRFTLASRTLSGVDLQLDITGLAARGSRRKQRESLWASVLATGCALAADLPTSCRLALPLDQAESSPDDLIVHLANNLITTKLNASRLELEFGESSLAVGDDALFYALSALRDLGVGLVFSGLGAGTTSMTLLRDRAFTGLITGLKLDRQILLRSTPHLFAEQALARAIVRFGADFGLPTRADGIDHEDTLAFLNEIGCLEGRGPLFGQPEPMAEFLTTHKLHLSAEAAAS